MFDIGLDVWVELPNAPGRGRKDVFSAGAVSAGSAALWGDGYPYLDTTTDTWFTAPTLDEGVAGSLQRWVHGVGLYGFVIGGARFGEDAFNGELLGDAWIWSTIGTNE